MMSLIVFQISSVICMSSLDSRISLFHGYLFASLFLGGLEIGFQLNLNLLNSSNILFCSSFIKLFFGNFNGISFDNSFFN
ncbi:hypothetical protein C2G38_2110768 [Gigaspora rosea]|uniref:Uncharacterized protein n=1 Tax=Gigaspora rosea TaxID=44941 RepID=A0A397UHA5_9GLOM|nr:hypothetical protein C2G38_2110768 [Gigaspora rosea]